MLADSANNASLAEHFNSLLFLAQVKLIDSQGLLAKVSQR